MNKSSLGTFWYFFILIFAMFKPNAAFCSKLFISQVCKEYANRQCLLFSRTATIRKKKIPLSKIEDSIDSIKDLLPQNSEPSLNGANEKSIFSMKTTETSRFTRAEALSPLSQLHEQAEVSNSVSFAVYGEPLALARHRSSRSGIMYNPSSKFQKDFLKLSKPFLPLKPMDGPIVATFSFFFSRPKSHYGTGKNSHIMKKGQPKYHDSRSDLDNLVKFVMDALNGVAYDDDSQICNISCTKMYVASIDDPARIEVHFRSLTKDENSP